MREKGKLVLKNGIGYGIVALSLGYIGKIGVIGWKGIFTIPHPSHLIIYLLSFSVAYAGLVSLIALRWKGILDALCGTSLSSKTAFIVYAKANIAKYLPGNVMHFVGRNYLGHQMGWSHHHLVISQVIELALTIGTAGILAGICSFREFRQVIEYYAPFWNAGEMMSSKAILLTGGIGLLCGVSGILLYRKNTAMRRKIRATVLSFISWALARQCLYAMLLYSIFFGGHGFMLSNIFVGVLGIEMTTRQMATVMNFYLVAWIVGFITPGSPGGMGVREGVLLLLLSPLFPQTPTLQALVLHRLVSVVGDALVFGIAIAIDRLKC